MCAGPPAMSAPRENQGLWPWGCELVPSTHRGVTLSALHCHQKPSAHSSAPGRMRVSPPLHLSDLSSEGHSHDNIPAGWAIHHVSNEIPACLRNCHLSWRWSMLGEDPGGFWGSVPGLRNEKCAAAAALQPLHSKGGQGSAIFGWDAIPW